MGQIIPVPHQSISQNNFAATPSGNTTVLTSNSTVHTKATTYSTIIAATTYDAYGFWLNFGNSLLAATVTAMLCDIAIGAAAAEVIIAPNVQCGWRPNTTTGGVPIYYPIFIPRGSRVSGRLQATISSDTVAATIMLNSGTSDAQPIFAGSDVYGVDTANSRGVLHTPGSTGTESTDANVGSTTTKNYGAVLIEIGCGASTVVTTVNDHFELTDGTNTLAEWFAGYTTSEGICAFFPAGPVYLNIKSGTQLMVQAECSTTAEQRDVQFRCFY